MQAIDEIMATASVATTRDGDTDRPCVATAHPDTAWYASLPTRIRAWGRDEDDAMRALREAVQCAIERN